MPQAQYFLLYSSVRTKCLRVSTHPPEYLPWFGSITEPLILYYYAAVLILYHYAVIYAVF